MASKFCTNCGSALKMGAKFCGGCGNPVSVVNKTNTTKQGGNALAYRFITSASCRKKFLISKSCTLIFTDTRILVAFVDKLIMNQHIEKIQNKHAGEGYFKRTAAAIGARSTFPQRYKSMSESEILSETVDNFYIQNNNITRIKFSKGYTTYDEDNTSHEHSPELKIKSPGERYSFRLHDGLDEKTFISVLRSLFPSSYKGPKK